MNYELLSLYIALIFNALVIVAVMLSQNAKYDARFDAMTSRIDALHHEVMELIKKMK